LLSGSDAGAAGYRKTGSQLLIGYLLSMDLDSAQAKGGRNRASRLSAQDRKEIASKAAEARWGFALPQATHAGDLIIGTRRISCAVLQNKKRILTQGTFLTAIGLPAKTTARTGNSGLVDGLPSFLVAENLKPFLSDELTQLTTPIVFRTVEKVRAVGYDASLLPMVCDLYLKVRDQGKLLKVQEPIATACDMLQKGTCRPGIIALVDEASGYQEHKAMEELTRIMEAAVEGEYRRWTPLFPKEFFRQIYRINGWAYKPGNAKSSAFVKRLINNHVYGRLPPRVLEELRQLRPDEKRRREHPQDLTANTGNIDLDRQIVMLTTLMRISENKEDLERYIDKVFGASASTIQERPPLVIPVDSEPADVMLVKL
jgi:hypothetical protein